MSVVGSMEGKVWRVHWVVVRKGFWGGCVVGREEDEGVGGGMILDVSSLRIGSVGAEWRSASM